MDLPAPDTLVEEQIEYYRARAPEYDDWWLRTGHYNGSDGFSERWDRAKLDLEEALNEFAPGGDVLEIAAGTGNLTSSLLRHDAVTTLTAIDSSAETFAVARTKIGDDPRVTFEQADVFAWTPPRQYDVVAFGFWISHVPPGLFATFWDRVAAALRPGGRVWLIDNAIPVEEAVPEEERQPSRAWSKTWLDRGVSVRTLSDGRQFHVVKRLWSPGELVSELSALGWTFQAREHQRLFISASGTHGASADAR